MPRYSSKEIIKRAKNFSNNIKKDEKRRGLIAGSVIPGPASFGAKKTFADKTLSALYKGAKSAAQKRKLLDAYTKLGSVKKAIASVGSKAGQAGVAKTSGVVAGGALAGAALLGAGAIGYAKKKFNKEQDKYTKQTLEQGEEIRQAAIRQRNKKKK